MQDAINKYIVTKSLHQFIKAISIVDGPLLGIDLSPKAVGLAITDEKRLISFPHSYYDRRKNLFHCEEISKICIEQNISGIILGLPLDNDGKVREPRIKDMDIFYKSLTKHLDNKKKNICWLLYSERFSTKFSKKSIFALKKKREVPKTLEDKIAAQHILSNALESMQSIIFDRKI